MSMNRRQFLSSTAATAASATLMGLSGARALPPAREINVAAIYDLSGGLDIYGKPVMDALRFAAERSTPRAVCSAGN